MRGSILLGNGPFKFFTTLHRCAIILEDVKSATNLGLGDLFHRGSELQFLLLVHFTEQHYIFAADDKDAYRDIGEGVLHGETFHGVVEDEIGVLIEGSEPADECAAVTKTDEHELVELFVQTGSAG